MEVQDLISSLPDEILEHILSFLPTKKAVSTSVLSKRWRNVFSLVPNLEFDFPDPLHLHETRPHYKPEYRREFIEFVEHILNLHGSSRINRFSLNYHLRFDQTSFESWIVKALELGAADLELQRITNPYGSVIYQALPSLIFESRILVKLRLGRCYTIKLSQDAYLPMLKTLYLTSVSFEGDPSVLETLISRCPVLEDLVVEEFRKQRSSWAFSVSSHSLKRLCFRFGSRCKVVLIDVPNVVYFEFSCPFWSRFSEFKLDSLVESRIDFYQCNSRLEGINTFANVKSLVNAIRNVRVLHLSQRVLELFYYYSKKLPLGFDNLVYLSVESAEKRGWQILPLLIKISPNLETVIFKGLDKRRTEYFEEDYRYDSEENMSSCLSSSRLKTLEISGDHKGTTRELSQMKHFLEKLPCLELVKIDVDGNNWDYFEVIMDMVPGAILKCNNRVQVIFEPTQDKEAVSASH